MELKVCRTCLERSATVSVFDCEGGVQYCTKLMKCAAVEVAEGDGLPDTICERCARELAASYLFAARCEASDRTLRSLHAGAATGLSLHEHSKVEHMKHEIKSELDLPHYNDHFDSYPHFENNTNSNVQQMCNTDSYEVKLDSKLFFNESKNCKQEYNYNKRTLPNHLRTRRVRVKTGPIQCPVCDRKVSCHSAFQLHMRTHTKEKPYSCDLCKKSYSTKHLLKRHIIKHYGIQDKTNLQRKAYKRESRTRVQCTICGLMQLSNAAMEAHMRKHTGEKPFVCPLCGNKYSQKVALKRHTQYTHPELTPDAKFICEHCGKTFYARSNIITHMRTHTGDKPYTCPYCPARFAQSASLIRHKRGHTGEKPYTCTICGRSFRESTVLKKHMYVHVTEKNFNCHICKKSYKTVEYLRLHLTSHGRKKSWVCSCCGLATSTKGNLKIHMQRMHSERSGTCSVCNKHYGDLAAHMPAHTGEKPLQCKICEQSYASKRSLSYHMGFKHRNATKFKCTVEDCHKTFPTAPMLEFHVLKCHSARTPYVCEHCARAFLRACDLSRHLKLNHQHNDSHTVPRAAATMHAHTDTLS